MATRFKIGSDIFKADDLDSVKLADTFVFAEQVYAYKNTPREQGGEPDFPLLNWSDIEQAMVEISALPEKEAERHPRANLITAATLWLTMRSAGKPMAFGELMELDLGKDIVWLPDTEDRKPNPTKRKPSQKASVQVAVNAEAEDVSADVE